MFELSRVRLWGCGRTHRIVSFNCPLAVEEHELLDGDLLEERVESVEPEDLAMACGAGGVCSRRPGQ